MTRNAKLLLLLFLCLLASVLIVTVPALSGGELKSTVLVKVYSGKNSYIESFSSGNPQGNTLFSSQSLPREIPPETVGISGDGQWLFARANSNTSRYMPLLMTQTGHLFTNPPIFATWTSLSDDSQYLFYISVDSSGYYETYNFLKLSTGALTELLVAPLSQPANPNSPPFQMPQYAVPMPGWTLKNNQVVFTSYPAYPRYAGDLDGFYRVDLSAINLARSGIWAMPKRTAIPRAGQITSEGSLSPDGILLAYIYVPDGTQVISYADTTNIMAVQNLNTGERKTVKARSEETITRLQWARDNTTIVYTARSIDYDTWQDTAYNIKSQQRVRLPMNGSNSVLCGNEIFYIKDKFRQSTLYSVDLQDADNPKVLFTAAGIDLLTCGTPFTWNSDEGGICSPFCTPTPVWPVGSSGDVDVQKLDLSGGNAANGQKLYTNYGCATCHQQGTIGPITQGTYTRVITQRLKEPQLAGLTPEQYIAESILQPDAYIVPNYPANVMPKTFGDQFTLGELQDLIAYLMAQN